MSSVWLSDVLACEGRVQLIGCRPKFLSRTNSRSYQRWLRKWTASGTWVLSVEAQLEGLWPFKGLFWQKSLCGLMSNWVAKKAFLYKSRYPCEVWISAVAQLMNRQSPWEEREALKSSESEVSAKPRVTAGRAPGLRTWDTNRWLRVDGQSGSHVFSLKDGISCHIREKFHAGLIRPSMTRSLQSSSGVLPNKESLWQICFHMGPIRQRDLDQESMSPRHRHL